MERFRPNKCLLTLIGIILCLPYFFILSKAELSLESFSLFFDVLPYSLLQSLSSTLVTVICGIWGALGLFWLEKKIAPWQYSIAEFFILLPSLLPAIFLVVSTLNLTPNFPFGLAGVIVLHGLTEIGIAALIIKKIFLNKLSYLSEYSFLSGASQFFFLRKSASLVVRDMAQLSIIFLVYFLTSFSIPLLIAGRTYSTVEVVLYRLITVSHNWPLASSIVFIQIFFIAVMLLLINFLEKEKADLSNVGPMKLLAHASGLLPIFLPPLILVLGIVRSIAPGLRMLYLQQDVWVHWFDYLIGSLLIGFLTGGCAFLILSLSSYAFYFKYFRKFVEVFFTPSYVAIGFGFLLLQNYIKIPLSIYISWALAIAFFPALFRFGIMQTLESLDSQLEYANYIGNSFNYSFKKVIYPQVLPQICLVSGLCGLWAVGDFSLSRVIVGVDITLAMWVQSLIEQYRWDLAALFSILILLSGFFVFSFFWSAYYVSRQKLS